MLHRSISVMRWRQKCRHIMRVLHGWLNDQKLKRQICA